MNHHEAYEEPQLSVSAQECDSFNATVSIFVKSCVCQLNIALKHFSYRTESPTGRLKREKTVSLINPEKYLLLQFHSNALAAVRRSTHYKSMLLMANCSKQRMPAPRTDVITAHKWSVTGWMSCHLFCSHISQQSWQKHTHSALK